MKTYKTYATAKAALSKTDGRGRWDVRNPDIREAARVDGYYIIDRGGYLRVPGRLIDPRNDQDARLLLGD